jgi:NAD+ synthase
MNRIEDYKELESRIVTWITDYVNKNNLRGLVIGVSGGIDSAVVSTLCAKTGLPTYVMTMPLHSSSKNDELSDAYSNYLEDNYDNVTKIHVPLTEVYDQLISTFNFWVGQDEFTNNDLANANTKSRMRMVSLYQIAGSVGGIVVGTGNKVEDYGVGFYTKYGDGGVDIAPIADLYKTEVRELGGHLGVDALIIDAKPTDGLWEDGRTDEDQIGATYEELEEAMENGEGKGVDILYKFNNQNSHKMQPIPTFKL